MYRLLIVEDDEEQALALETIIKNNFPMIEITTCNSYKTAISPIQNQDTIFHFFFLDVDLQGDSGKDGLTLGECIRSQTRYEYTPIIYVTSYTDKVQYALNQIHCTDFISKPYVPRNIIATLSRLLRAPSIEHAPVTIQDLDGIYYQVQQKDIIYVKSEQKNLVIFTVYDTFTTRSYSLSKMLNHLSLPGLTQCHRSYIVNLNYVKNYDKANLLLNLRQPFGEDFSIAVSRSYQTEIERQLNCT